MYEVGALLAVDDYLGASSGTAPLGSTRFDIYVGISAGAFVATALCGGISPERLARAVMPHPRERHLAPQRRSEVFRFEPLRAARHGVRLGATLVRSLLKVAAGRMGAREIAGELAAATPSGVFSLRSYQRFLERFLRRHGLPRQLSEMPRELYIPANDLDSGRRVVFGDPGGAFGHSHTTDLSGVGVAEAICASSAIPIVFEPVRVRGRDYIDGGTGKADHIDVALKRGAKLVLAINPMVPIAHDPASGAGLPGRRGDRLREHGLFTVYDQTMRMAIKARLHQGLRRWQAEYPDADILLLEPDERDADMFLQNPMNFDAREQIISYGYRSAAHQLRSRGSLFAAMCARHGLAGDPSRLKLAWP
jgi:predicted acylesterase/phospholipase RssA